MKTYRFILLLSFLWTFAQCTKDDEKELDKGSTALAVTPSSSNLTLDASNPALEALKLTWTSGTNYGTNAAISYTFQMDKKGNNFQGGISLDLGREVYEKTYTNEELNELLISTFEAEAESETSVEVRIKAKVSNKNATEQISESKIIVIKTHTPISKVLYLIGSATPNGWDANNATEMTAVSGSPKNFTWRGELATGELKFITTLGEFLPCYTKGSSDTELFYRTDDSQPDDKFIITQAGTYTIQVNLITKTISLAKGEGAEYKQLWFVGNASGWSFVEMTRDPLDEFVFHYNADLSAGGEFKIATRTNFDSSTVFYRPETNGQAEGTNLPVVKWGEDTGADYKWNISSGVYKIKLNTRTMKIDIEKFTPYTGIYMVGSATSIGWDIANALPMNTTSDPYQFEWTGNLKEGELKLSCDKQGDWGGAWFLADKENKAPAGTEEIMHFSASGDGGKDYKWKITEAGTYKISLNQLTHRVIIKKQ